MHGRTACRRPTLPRNSALLEVMRMYASSAGVILHRPSIESKSIGIQAMSRSLESLQLVYAEKDCCLGEGRRGE